MIFTIITLLFLIACSIGTVSVYSKYAPRTSDVHVADESHQFIFANLVDRYSKTLLYEVTNIETDEEKPLVNYVDPDIVNNFEYYYDQLMSDPNIKMQMMLDGKVVRSNITAFNSDEWAWYAQVVYDENGHCMSKSSNSINYCSYIPFTYYYPIDREDGVYEAEPKSENPKNLSFTFALPSELKTRGTFYNEMISYYQTLDWHQINAFFLIVTGISRFLYC